MDEHGECSLRDGDFSGRRRSCSGAIWKHKRTCEVGAPLHVAVQTGKSLFYAGRRESEQRPKGPSRAAYCLAARDYQKSADVS